MILYTGSAARTGNTIGTIVVLSRFVIKRGALWSGTVCLLKLMIG